MPCSSLCNIENNGIEYPCLAVFYVVLNTVGLNICALQFFMYVILNTMGLNICALQFFM